jgi:FkbM family methyltransferase
MTSVVTRGWSVFDVGDQLGYVTAQLARLVGPAGKVSSFQPDPNGLERLTRTIQENGARHVTIFP